MKHFLMDSKANSPTPLAIKNSSKSIGYIRLISILPIGNEDVCRKAIPNKDPLAI